MRPRTASRLLSRFINLVQHPNAPIAAILFALSLTGLAWAPDYGPSWDESNTVPYGSETLDAYLRGVSQHEQQGNLKYYGPVFFAAVEVVASIGRPISPGWARLEIRHLIYFSSLLVATLALYSVTARWFGRWSGFTASALFATQPLIFGHAFVNSKDTPFMAAFLLSFALGMRMIERIVKGRGSASAARPQGVGRWMQLPRRLRADLAASKRETRIALLVALLVPALSAVELLRLRQFVLPAARSIVRSGYEQTAWPLVNRLFHIVAERSSEVPVASYVRKADELYMLLDFPVAMALFVPAALLAHKVFRPTLVVYWPRDFGAQQTAAGVALGLAIAVRVVAPFAGILVSMLAIGRQGRNALRSLLWYWLVASAVAYLAWPFLWGAPLARAWQAVRVMRDFETTGPVLFQGEVLESTALPWYALPLWWGIQLTLPAIALGLLGLVLGVRESVAGRTPRLPVLILILWLALPIATAIAGTGSRYDNGRQFLFALPPIFMLSAIGIRHLIQGIHNSGLRLVGVGLVIFPGLLAIVSLHPYEYVYYNALVGGVRGAYREFELDYWATAYREALEALSLSAEPESRIFMYGPWEVLWPLARSDFRLYDPPDHVFDREAVDYLIVTTRANADLDYRAWAERVAEVQVNGVPLAYVLRSPE